MIPRYSREAMARIWSEENKFAAWLKVELAAMVANSTLSQAANLFSSDQMWAMASRL